MAAYARTPSALTWLRINHLIYGLHKQISCKNCLYAVNSYFTIVCLLFMLHFVVGTIVHGHNTVEHSVTGANNCTGANCVWPYV